MDNGVADETELEKYIGKNLDHYQRDMMMGDKIGIEAERIFQADYLPTIPDTYSDYLR